MAGRLLVIGVVLNPRSGYVRQHGAPRVCDQIAQVLPDARIHLLQHGDDVGALCKAFIADGATCIVAAGGDGTVNAVASHLVGTPTVLGVLPMGTLNHFARDVGVGRDVPAALQVLAEGHVLPVDVASVNDRVFVNNSSIGLYARMVEIRERYEQHLGKWRALAYAATMVLRRAEATVVDLSSQASTERIHTYMLFVGNNQYELDLLHLGQRAKLDAGELCCFILEGGRRISLLPHVFRYLRNHHPDRRLFRSLLTTELTVRVAGRRAIEVACDGEVFRLTTPLRYRALPKALRVVAPLPPPLESREVRSATD